MHNFKNVTKETICIIVSFIVLLIILSLPKPSGLTIEGKKSLAIFAMAFILWMTNALPLSVTGLLVIGLIPLLGILNYSSTFALFGNQAIFFILGAFIIATAMMKSGLSKRMALIILRRFDQGPRRLIGGILLSCALMSFIMPSHAVAALMFPIISTLTDVLELMPLESDYGAALFLSLAYGSSIGSIGTLLGGARTPLAIAILEETCNLSISFLEWAIAVIPMVFIMIFIASIVITRCFRMEKHNISRAKNRLEQVIVEIGKVSVLEIKTMIIILITLFFWIFWGQKYGIAVISILSSVFFFIMRCVKWDDVQSYVNWGVILMYGGAIVIAKTVEQTGATLWLVNTLLSGTNLGGFTILIFFAIISKLLTEAISNVACVATILPVALSLCGVYSINPVIMLYFITVSSGLAFILPMGTPANAIAYSAGYYEIKRLIKPGIILNILSLLVFIIMTKIYWPVIGLGFW